MFGTFNIDSGILWMKGDVGESKAVKDIELVFDALNLSSDFLGENSKYVIREDGTLEFTNALFRSDASLPLYSFGLNWEISLRNNDGGADFCFPTFFKNDCNPFKRNDNNHSDVTFFFNFACDPFSAFRGNSNETYSDIKDIRTHATGKDISANYLFVSELTSFSADGNFDDVQKKCILRDLQQWGGQKNGGDLSLIKDKCLGNAGTEVQNVAFIKGAPLKISEQVVNQIKGRRKAANTIEVNLYCGILHGIGGNYLSKEQMDEWLAKNGWDLCEGSNISLLSKRLNDNGVTEWFCFYRYISRAVGLSQVSSNGWLRLNDLNQQQLMRFFVGMMVAGDNYRDESVEPVEKKSAEPLYVKIFEEPFSLEHEPATSLRTLLTRIFAVNYPENGGVLPTIAESMSSDDASSDSDNPLGNIR